MKNFLLPALLSVSSVFLGLPALATWVTPPPSPLPGQIELLNYEDSPDFGPGGPFFKREDGTPTPVVSFGRAHTSDNLGDCVLVYGTFADLDADSPVFCFWLTNARYGRYDLTTFNDAYKYAWSETQHDAGLHVATYVEAQYLGAEIYYNDSESGRFFRNRN